MDIIQKFREYTRTLECHLGNMNKADCCQCGVSESQCFLIVEIGRRSVEELVKKDYVERNPSKEDQRCVAFHLPKM